MSRISGSLWFKWRGLALALVSFLVLVPRADGQLNRGYISGTVLDAQDASVAGVEVVATNQLTNSKLPTTTNQQGFYRFAALDPGEYSVDFKKSGFDSITVQEIQVLASLEKTINASLNVSTKAIETTVDVTDIPGVELAKSNAAVQQTLTGQTLDEIPMSTSSLVPGGARNFARYTLFAPTVVRVQGQNEISASGHRGRDNNWLLDGVDNNDNTVTLPALFIPPEAIREVQIQVSTFSAEFGRNIGAQINVITKRGTNRYHGELWEFFRSSVLEPLSLQTQKAGFKKTPRLVDHQFGADIGGPVIRNKTFFFGIFQGNFQRQAARTLSSVTIPTTAGYAALLRAPLRTSSPPFQSAASRQAILERLSFLTEVYPTLNGFSATAMETVNSTPIEVGTFTPVLPSNKDLWYVGFRADHEIRSSAWLSYRTHIDKRKTPLDGSNLSFGERWAGDTAYLGQNHALSYTNVVNTSFLNEARLSYARLDPSFIERDPLSPTIRINSLSLAIGGLENYPQQRLEQTYQFQNVSTYMFQKHSLKFGVDLADTHLVLNSAPNSKGTWIFSNLESFMNNAATSLTQLGTASSRYSFHQLKQAYFFQDDVKLTRNFTANAGLRYETASVPLGYFGATTTELLNAMVPGPGKRDSNNWGPRVGFAYSPDFQRGIPGKLFGAGRSSIRGGFGISYDTLFYSLLTFPAGNYPRNSPTQQTQGAELVDLFPRQLAQTPVIPPLSSLTNFVNIPSDAQNPTAHYWTLSVQRELGRSNVLELGYSGNLSYHLIRQGQANPTVLTEARAAAVIAACAAANEQSCAEPTPPRLNPNWAARTLLETTGQGQYHAGYLRIQQRLSHGIQFGANYTWSANFSDSDDFSNDSGVDLSGGIAGSSPHVPQDYFDRHNDWARSAFDRPHRLALSYSYQIPWFNDTPAVFRRAFSGWQLSGFTELQSGQPFTIKVGVDSAGVGSMNGGRPDYNPNGILIADPVTGNLRTFVIPLDGSGIVTAPSVTNPATGAITFLKNSMAHGGTLGRNTFRGPGYANTNMSLMKRFNLPREAQLQIRGDFINVFNHDNSVNPDNNMSSASFGKQMYVPLTDARQVLVGAKITF